jgi:hypothetical protein
MEIFIISIILISFSLLLLGVRIFFNKILFNKQGKFPITAIGHNPEMKKIGISCSKHDEIKCYNRAKKGLNNNAIGSSCGCD